MKIEDIKTDAKGLVELIDFLHGLENTSNEDTGGGSHYYHFYALSSVEGISGEGRDHRIVSYNVGIKQIFGASEKEHQDKLLELIKKISV